MKITHINKKLASILMSGVILVTATGCQRIEESINEDINDLKSKLEEIIDLTKSNNEEPVEETTVPELTPKPTKEPKRNKKVEVNNYACVLNDTLLYNNPKDLNSDYYIEAYQKIYVKTIKGDYALIEDNNNKEGYIYTKDLELLPSTYVEVDISDQQVNLYSNGENILTSSVVTGKESTPTRIGYFDIDFKEYDT